MTFKEDLEKALADAGFPGVLTRRTENVRTYQPRGTSGWYQRKPVPVEWEIKFSTVLGEHPEWYSGILPKWSYDWTSHGVLRFTPMPDEEPQNDIPDLKNNDVRGNFFTPEYIRCPKILNLKSLDMTWDKDHNCVALYQKHRPFMENDHYGGYSFDKSSYRVIVPDVVKTMQLLKRIHGMAQPALETINNAILGFRAQIKKVKAKNELLNEREKVKIKQ